MCGFIYLGGSIVFVGKSNVALTVVPLKVMCLFFFSLFSDFSLCL